MLRHLCIYVKFFKTFFLYNDLVLEKILVRDTDTDTDIRPGPGSTQHQESKFQTFNPESEIRNEENEERLKRLKIVEKR